MFKLLSLLLLVFFLGPAAHANQYILTHERYIQMSEYDKEQLVIKTMEMMVELEAKYHKHVVENGFDQRLHERYTRTIRLLSNFLMSSAHAEEAAQRTNKDWKEYAQEFVQTLGKQDGKRCFYGGWVSQATHHPTTSGGYTSKCRHPRYLPEGSLERKSYEEFTSGCRLPNKDISKADQTKDQISCNPAIFGFKNELKKTLFCVPAGENPSFNSAYGCMQKALGIDKSDRDADPADQRVKSLKKNLTDHPEFVDDLAQFVYRACVCDSSTHLGNALDTRNIDLIRPHRTCLGMMKMMGETVTCETTGNTFHGVDLTIFRKLQQNELPSRLKSLVRPDGQNAIAINEHYKKFLEDIKANHNEDYKALCEEAPAEPEKAYTCAVSNCQELPAAEGAGAGAKKKYSCEVKAKDESDALSPLKVEKIEGEAGQVVNVDFPEGQPHAPVACKIDEAAPKKEYECKPTCTATDKTAPRAEGEGANAAAKKLMKCSFQALEIGSEPAVLVSLGDIEAAEGSSHTYNVNNSPETPVTCTVPAAGQPQDNGGNETSKCTVAIAKDGDTKLKAVVTLELKGGQTEKNPAVFTWSGTPDPASTGKEASYALPESGKLDITVKTEVMKNGTAIPVECPGTYPTENNADDGEKPSLAIKEDSQTDAQYTGSAAITGEKGSWAIEWFTEGGPASAAPADETVTVTPDNNDAEASETDDDAGAGAGSKSIGSGDKQTVDKTDKDYKLCAKLVKAGSEDIPAAPACLTVPKIAEKKEKPKRTSGGFVPPQGGPPMMMRPGGSNTSATGIR